jgi:CheY-like chemotaxis protein
MGWSVAEQGSTAVVLVVEDDGIIRAGIVTQLKAAGLTTLEAHNGEAAVARLLNGGPSIDLLLTDIQLGGRVDGWDVADAFRAADPDIRVVYASGNAPDRSRRAQSSLFFDKPYRLADVVAACRALLSKP